MATLRKHWRRAGSPFALEPGRHIHCANASFAVIGSLLLKPDEYWVQDYNLYFLKGGDGSQLQALEIEVDSLLGYNVCTMWLYRLQPIEAGPPRGEHILEESFSSYSLVGSGNYVLKGTTGASRIPESGSFLMYGYSSASDYVPVVSFNECWFIATGRHFIDPMTVRIV